ncbi:hypothetical protein [Ureibacillus sp. FSL W8-0352]|uniref:hypothetical protein n=1 Tax=Ureibacillus sp. FSL W8-0352 TaxID=2954596 RepID=UPI0030F50BBC
MMEKVLTIDGKQVKFVANGSTPIRYMAEFGKDYFEELTEIEKGNLSGMSFYRMVYLMAKTANKDIPPMEEWLASFDKFPIFDVYEQLSPLIFANIKTNKPNKKKNRLPKR